MHTSPEKDRNKKTKTFSEFQNAFLLPNLGIYIGNIIDFKMHYLINRCTDVKYTHRLKEVLLYRFA